jgi:hypothetical protein
VEALVETRLRAAEHLGHRRCASERKRNDPFVVERHVGLDRHLQPRDGLVQVGQLGIGLVEQQDAALQAAPGVLHLHGYRPRGVYSQLLLIEEAAGGACPYQLQLTGHVPTIERALAIHDGAEGQHAVPRQREGAARLERAIVIEPTALFGGVVNPDL